MYRDTCTADRNIDIGIDLRFLQSKHRPLISINVTIEYRAHLWL